MKIAVCMKQVPAYSDGNMDEKTGLLIRDGETVLNVYDLSALEAALQIKEKHGAEVSVFTMGPGKAAGLLKEAFAYGADKGFLISDPAFGGADVLATSYTLCQAIKSCGEYDLILCGRQTTDGDTGQVSGALAKWMKISYIPGVTAVKEVSRKKITFSYENDRDRVEAEGAYPLLMAVEREAFIPRMPSLKMKMVAKKKEIGTVTLDQLEDQDAEHYGQKGSATKVVRIFPPEKTKREQVKQIEGEKAAAYIAGVISDISYEKVKNDGNS